MKAETKKFLFDVGVVALGGVVDAAIEHVTRVFVSQSTVSLGGFTVDAGDVAGVGSAVAEIIAGKVWKKPRIVMFGTGGLAASLATMASRALVGSASARFVVPTQMSLSTRYSIAPASKGMYR